MSTKSAFLTTCAIGAILLAGCGGGGGGVGNVSPSIDDSPPIIWVWTGAADTIDLTAYATDLETAPADLVYSVVTQPVMDGSAATGIPGTVGVIDGADVFTDPTAVTYTPDGSTPHSGVEHFTFRVSDGMASDTATVWVGVNNTAPTGSGAVALATNEDTSLVIWLDALGVSDFDNDPVLFVRGDEPTNGGLSAFPATLVDLSTTTQFVTYMPNPNFPECPVGDTLPPSPPDDPGTDSFTFTVTDMVGTSAVITVNIDVNAVNDKPVAPAVGDTIYATVSAGQVVNIPLTALDPDNDPLDFTVTDISGLPPGGLLYDNNDGNAGILIDAPSIIYTVVDGNHQVNFQAPYDFWGDFSFTYAVTDGTETDTATVNITISAPPQSCWSWGWNNCGQLGQGHQDVYDPEFERNKGVVAGDDWQMADGGQFHTAFMSVHGNARTCGDNFNGQLGVGAGITDRGAPLSPTKFPNAVWVAAGMTHTVVAGSDGTCKASGKNDRGQLGNGGATGTVTQWLPVEVVFSDTHWPQAPVPTDPQPNIVMVAAGRLHTLFLDDTGDVWACGDDSYGQLGCGSANHQESAVKITGTLDTSFVEFIAAGGDHSMAITGDGNWATPPVGTLYSWGSDDNGQLGRIPPYDVPGGCLGGVTSVACGQKHTLATASDGTLWAWGDDQFGQIGNGNPPTGDIVIPVQVINIYDTTGTAVDVGTLFFVQVAAGGGYHSIARTAPVGGGSKNRVFACGKNDYGQVGDPTNTDVQIDFWTEISFWNNVLGVGAGWDHSFAIVQEWLDP